MKRTFETSDVLIEGAVAYVDEHHWSMVGLKHFGQRLVTHPDFVAILNEVSGLHDN
ncbi:MAG: hypothetical protein KJO80_07420 [Gammaproteobacteria bacterium]|nr:hypothetical protein [Gammaproteobacteria bacterium]